MNCPRGDQIIWLICFFSKVSAEHKRNEGREKRRRSEK